MIRRSARLRASGEGSRAGESLFEDLAGEADTSFGEAVTDHARAEADLFFADLMGEPVPARRSGAWGAEAMSDEQALPWVGPISALLGLIDGQFTPAQLADVKNVVVGLLFARKVANIVKVFLNAYATLARRNLPTRNAIFLPCHTFEAGFGTVGPNAPIGNWFSVQVLPRGSTAPLFEAFRQRGAAPQFGNRDNAGAPSGVFNPVFLTSSNQVDVAAMINAELDLQYGVPADANVQPWVVEAVAPWKRVGRALARTDITARQFGAEIGRAGYAGPTTDDGAAYGNMIASVHVQVLKALQWFLGGDLTGAVADVKTFAAAMLAEAAPRG